MTSGDRYIFWGATGHAKVLADLVRLQGGVVVALFDNDPMTTSPFENVPLFHGESGFMNWLNNAIAPLPLAAIAIGGANGKARCSIANNLAKVGIITPTLIHPNAIVADSACLANGCQILAGAIVGPDSHLEPHCIINSGAQVDHDCIIRQGTHIAPGAALCGCIEIGECTLIGPGTTIVPRVKVGRNSIVGAGSIVTRDIPDNVVAWGAPARIIRENSL